MKLTTTLDLLCKAGVCREGLRKLIKQIGLRYGRHKSINVLTLYKIFGREGLKWGFNCCEQPKDSVDSLFKKLNEEYKKIPGIPEWACRNKLELNDLFNRIQIELCNRGKIDPHNGQWALITAMKAERYWENFIYKKLTEKEEKEKNMIFKYLTWD